VKSKARCVCCDKALRPAPKYVVERGRAPTADGLKPTRGHEGNNAVCSQRCGFYTALALMRADPDILKLLPEGWNRNPYRSV